MEINHNGVTDQSYNYDNVFIRSIGIGLCRTLHSAVRWINTFEDGTKIRVVTPFYLAYIGDERYVLDAFIDDVVGKRVEQNTEQRPRGIVTFKTATPTSSELANPNVYLSQKTKVNNDLRKIISKVKAVPVTLQYDVEIHLATEIDAEKCFQKILDSFFNYQFYRIDYFGLNIDALFIQPDSQNIEITRESNLDTQDRYKKITYSLDVKSYYPIFQVSSDDLQVCDNDNDIDWELLGVPQPTKDYCSTLSNYYKNLNQDVSCNFSEVFWKAYIYEYNSRESIGFNNKEDDINRLSGNTMA